MKRYIASLRVEVEAESTEARDDVIWRLTERINKNRPSVYYDDVGGANVVSAKTVRVRPKRSRTKR